METTTLSAEGNNRAPVESTTDWMITLLITSIPLIGFIMLIVWAFGSGSNQNKVNFAKATLLWMAIIIVLGVLFSIIFGVAMFGKMDT